MNERRRIPARTSVETVVEPAEGLGDDPLTADALLDEAFYRAPQERRPSAPKEKPTHYKVISISLYQDDIELLESLVAELKRRGHTKANKSQLIRFALHTVDLDKLPRGY